MIFKNLDEAAKKLLEAAPMNCREPQLQNDEMTRVLINISGALSNILDFAHSLQIVLPKCSMRLLKYLCSVYTAINRRFIEFKIQNLCLLSRSAKNQSSKFMNVEKKYNNYSQLKRKMPSLNRKINVSSFRY